MTDRISACACKHETVIRSNSDSDFSRATDCGIDHLTAQMSLVSNLGSLHGVLCIVLPFGI